MRYLHYMTHLQYESIFKYTTYNRFVTLLQGNYLSFEKIHTLHN
jgi:hypothetical protein